MAFPTIAALALLLGAGTLSALEYRELPKPQNILAEQQKLSAPWAEFLREYPGSRILDWDRFHPSPHRIFPAALDLPGGDILDAEDLEERLRRFMADRPQLFPVAGIEARHIALRGRLWIADFRILADGWPLFDQDLLFRVSPEGRVLAFGCDTPADLPSVVEHHSARELLKRARDLAAGLDPLATVHETGKALLPIYGEDELRFEAARAYHLEPSDPSLAAVVWLSAESGEVLWARPGVYHLNGHVCILAEEQQPSDGLSLMPGANLRIDVDGETVVTGADGSFSAETDGEGPWWVGVELAGEYAAVNRMDGVSGYYDAVQLGEGDTLFVSGLAHIAERDGYVHTNRVYEWIKELDPSFTGQDAPMPVNVNISQTCNAFYSPSANTINFYSAGGGCPNTGQIAGVVYHEYGHGINHRQYQQAGVGQGMTNGALHEGLADVTAVYLQDVDFVSPGWTLRALENTRRYPEDILPEVHYDGQIVGGAMWDLRQAIGLQAARPLHHFARWGAPDDNNTGRAFFEYYIEVLLADDDNGDLGDQTPHWEEIDAAFNAHGIGSEAAWEFFHFTLFEPALWIPANQPTSLGVLGELPPLIIQDEMELRYRVDGGDWQSIVMEQEGFTWNAELPGQPDNSLVDVYAALGDVSSPPDGAEGPYRIAVGGTPPLLLDFEEGPEGFSLGGSWEWGEVSSGPGSAHSGTAALGTNLDGAYPTQDWSVLQSSDWVVLDHAYPALSLAYFMDSHTNEDGGNLEWKPSGGDWQLLEPRSGYSGILYSSQPQSGQPGWSGGMFDWQSLSVLLPGSLQPGDRLQLRFNFFSGFMQPLDGWYLDDFQLLGLAPLPVMHHLPQADSEDTGQEQIPLELQLESLLELNSLILVYRLDEGPETSLPLAAGETPGSWQGAIPGPFSEGTVVDYRVEGLFSGNVEVLEPAEGWHRFRLGADSEAPVAAFLQAPVDLIGASGWITVEAEAEDNLGLAVVELEARLEGGDWITQAALEEAGSRWSWSGPLDFGGTGELEYRLKATDASQAANVGYSGIAVASLGQRQPIDDFESGDSAGWELSGEWAIQDNRVSPGGSFALGSSSDGFYEAGSNGIALVPGSFDLSQATSAWLVLDEQVFMQPGMDFVYIEASADGNQWEQLAERGGVIATWTGASFPLDAWLGEAELRLRFRMAADMDDSGLRIGYFADNLRLEADPSVAVEEPPVTRPAGFVLDAAAPNPFNPQTRLRVELPREGRLQAAVYNMLGQRVQDLVDSRLPAGEYWLGVDGRSLPSGVYIVRARSGGQLQSRKILLLK